MYISLLNSCWVATCEKWKLAFDNQNTSTTVFSKLLHLADANMAFKQRNEYLWGDVRMIFKFFSIAAQSLVCSRVGPWYTNYRFIHHILLCFCLHYYFNLNLRIKLVSRGPNNQASRHSNYSLAPGLLSLVKGKQMEYRQGLEE